MKKNQFPRRYCSLRIMNQKIRQNRSPQHGIVGCEGEMSDTLLSTTSAHVTLRVMLQDFMP